MLSRRTRPGPGCKEIRDRPNDGWIAQYAIMPEVMGTDEIRPRPPGRHQSPFLYRYFLVISIVNDQPQDGKILYPRHRRISLIEVLSVDRFEQAALLARYARPQF